VRWDEAHDRLAAALSEAAAGRTRLVWISGARHPRLSHALARRVAHFVPGTRLLRAAGARAATARAFAGLLGPDDRATPESVAAADLLVAWGADPARLPRPVDFAWRCAVERGAGRLFVDPCAAAAHGSEFVQLGAWPGTDVAVALAIIRLLVENGSARRAPEAALHPEIERWTPARAASVSHVSEAAFGAAAERLGRAQRAAIVVGGGAARHGEAAAVAAAILALARAAGARLLVPPLEPDPAQLVPMPIGIPPADEVLEPAWGAPSFSEDGLGVLLVVEDAEQLTGRGGWGALERLARGARLAVVLGQYPGALAREASLFLPVASHLEQEDVVGLGAAAWRGEAARPVPRGVLPATAVLRAAARRLGWPERWFPAEPAAWVAEAGDRAVPALTTRQAAAVPVLREAGEGPRSAPALYERYPLALVVGRLDDRSAAGVSAPAPTLLMEPGDALRRGLAEGGPAVVANDRGRLPVTVRCEPRQPRGVVAVLPGGLEPPVELGRLFPDLAPAGSAGGAAIALVEVGPAGAA
jgi:anaerobic selenocysteine-containing dehydrogenase